MNAPQKSLSAEKFCRVFLDYIGKKCQKTDDGYACATCGTRILFATAVVSLHVIEFEPECSGFGEVKHVPLPYCPQCEGKPREISTCVHLPFTQPSVPFEVFELTA
jgi:hypothetical protein